LRHALDGEGAEFCVFLSDLAQLLKLRVVTPSLNFFHAVPDLHDGSLRRRAIERSYLLCGAGPASSADGKRNPLQPKQSRRKERECCLSFASRSLATALFEGALARGLLRIGENQGGGQFLMSPRGQFRMSLDIHSSSPSWGWTKL
jgi:hypothetical protein